MGTPPGDGTFTPEVFEAQLKAERDRTDELVRDLKGELAAIAESTAAVPDDEHDAEGSTVAYERARVQALLAHTERAAEQLEAAYQRVGHEGLGTGASAAARCQLCDGPIPIERLIALPATRICVTCAASRR